MGERFDPELDRRLEDAGRAFREDTSARLTESAEPILGLQAARLGADRFAALVEGHATLQAMSLFLVMSAMTVPQAGYSDAALQAFRQDARDVRAAAGRWARTCEQLADHWQAQRQEHE